MLLSNIPAKIAAIFAASGTKNTIPLTTAGVANTNNASFDVGFPPITMTPVISGGLPPFGADFNGLLNAVTAVQQWQGAGGLFPYDAAFSASIGGYPKGATLLMAGGVGTWQSTLDNNTSNPDTGGAGWTQSVNLGQFPALLSHTGYFEIPVIFSGVIKTIIVQFGSAVTTGSGGVTATFPIPFPNAIFQVVPGSLNTDPIIVTFQSPTLTGVFLQAWTTAGILESGNSVSYIAIGY